MDEFEYCREETFRWARKRERKFLEEWCKEAGVTTPVGYNYEYGVGFTVYTDHPGWLIGFHGTLVDKYSKKLQKEFGTNEKLKIVEIKSGFANF